MKIAIISFKQLTKIKMSIMDAKDNLVKKVKFEHIFQFKIIKIQIKKTPYPLAYLIKWVNYQNNKEATKRAKS